MYYFYFLFIVLFSFPLNLFSFNDVVYTDRVEHFQSKYGKLEVVSTIPEGDVFLDERINEIVFTFSKDILPLQDVESLNIKYRCEPPLNGIFKSKGKNTIVFYIDSFMPEKSYRFVIEKGLLSLDSSILSEDFVLTIKPVNFSVVKTSYYKIHSDSFFYIVFNYKIPFEILSKSTILKCEDKKVEKVIEESKTIGKETYYNYEYFYNKGDTSSFYRVKLKEKGGFKKAKDYSLEIFNEEFMREKIVLRFSIYDDFKYVHKSDSCLPILDQKTSFDIEFSTPVKVDEIVKNVKFISDGKEEEILDYFYYDESPIFYLNKVLKPDGEYFLKINGNLKDIFNQKIKNPGKYKIFVKDYQPFVLFNQSYLRKSSNLMLNFSLMNLKNIRVYVKERTKEEFIEDFISLNYANYYKSWKNKKFDFDVNKNVLYTDSIDLLKEFSLKENIGFGFLEYGLDGNDYGFEFIYQKTPFKVSGILSDKNGFLVVSNYESNQTFKGNVKLKIFDQNGKERFSKKVKDGICQLKNNEIKFFQKNNSETARFIYVENGSKNLIFPLYFEKSENFYKGYLFTDRNLYTLNDSVLITGILRESKGNRIFLPKIKNLEYFILNPEYKQIKEGSIKLNKDGSFLLNFSIEDTFKTGYYYVNFYSKEIFVGQTSFMVQEFKEPKFEVVINSKNNFLSDEDVEIFIEAKYLSGFQMANDSLYCYLQITEVPFFSKKFSDFNFYIYSEVDNEQKNLFEKKYVLDGAGKFLFKEKIPIEEIKNPVFVNFIATVKDLNRETVSKNVSFTKNIKDRYAGLKVSHISENDDSSLLEVVVVDEHDMLVKGEKIVLNIFKLFSYNDSLHDTIKSVQFFTDQRVDSFWVKLPKNSYYKVELHYDGGKIVDRFYKGFFYYDETDYSGIYVLKNKDKYDIGDTVILKITSNDKDVEHYYYINKDSIFKFENLSFKNNDTLLLKIPVEENLYGGFYFTIFNLKSDPLYNNPKISTHFIDVSSESKRLKFEMLTEKEKYSPGDSVTVELKTDEKKKCNAILFVVDESVLMLTGYSYTDPLSTFYSYYSNDASFVNSDNFYPPSIFRYYSSKMMDGDRSEELNPLSYKDKKYTENLNEYSDINKDEYSGFEKETDIKFRKDFKSLVFCKKDIEFSNRKDLKIKFKLPDNMGKFRIVCIAFDEEKFNIKEKSIRVDKEIIINHSFPLFLRPFDEMDFSFVVLDNSIKKGDVKTTVFSKEIEFSEKTKKFNSSDQKILVDFKGKVLFEDSAKIYIKVEKDSLTDGIVLNLPIINHNLYEYSSLFSSSDSSEVIEYFNVSKGVNKSKSFIKINLNSTLIGGMILPLDYLKDYPYLCLEQKLSKIFPLIIGEDIINFYNLSELKGATLRKFVGSILKDLENFQSENGGFKYFESDLYENEYLSVYTMYVIHHAIAKGYKINDKVKEKGLNYLESLLEKNHNSLWGYSLNAKYSLEAFSLYVLSLYGKSNHYEKIKEIFSNRDKLYLAEKARLVETLKNYSLTDEQKTLLSEIKSNAKFESDYLFFEEKFLDWWFFNSNLKATAAVLTSILKTEGNYEYAPLVVSYILKNLQNGFWINTHTTSLVFEALNEYYKTYEKERTDFKILLKFNDKTFYKKSFKGKKDNSSTYLLEGKNFKDGVNILKFEKKGKGRIYYALKYRYTKNGIEKKLFNGFTVEREYLNINDEPVKVFKKGEFYKVKLKITTDKPRTFVVLEDNIPAGFEIVKREFLTEFLNLAGFNFKNLWWGDFYHEEFYRDRVLTSSIYLYEGEHVFTYFVKATVSGRFEVPPASVFEMYNPEIFGHTDSIIIEIE
ncbi:MAG: MG2 domain-containing protein [candidate division WOR-3 bacterium]